MEKEEDKPPESEESIKADSEVEDPKLKVGNVFEYLEGSKRGRIKR